MSSPPDAAARARAWRDALHEEFCDVVEPWEHGTVVRASALPDYWDFNVVRVESSTGMTADELSAFADEALDGLAHRKVDVDLTQAGDALRPGFEALGWRTTALVWMRFEGPLPPGPEIAVEEVGYDAVHELRVAWHEEDYPGVPQGGYWAQSRDVALRRGTVVLATYLEGEAVGFAELERRGGSAEIASVYVAAGHRGGGMGTAMTRAAIEAGSDAGDLWIAADAEARPRDLYARLGFRPVWTPVEFLLTPG